MSEQISPLPDRSSTARTSAPARLLPQVRFEAITGDWSRILVALALAGVLILGGYLRLTHVNWDGYGHLHPDERFITQISGDIQAPSSIANYFDSDTSALNPYNIQKPDGSRQPTFVYGTLPLFLNKLVASNLAWLSFGYYDDYDNYDHYNLSGRALSAVFDLGTIVLVFLIGRQLAGRFAGLLGAFLYAVAPFPIQNAHFFIVDPFVAFFATFTIYFAIRSAMQGGWWNFAIAGAGAGLAAACKVTAISLLPVVLLAIGVRAWPGFKPYLAPLWYGDGPAYRRQRDGRRLDASAGTLVIGSCIALAAAFVAFRIAMPYAFDTPSVGGFLSLTEGKVWKVPFVYPDIMSRHWLDDQVQQQQLLSGDAAFPPNVQWIGRSKWIWPAQQMVAWGMGPALGVTALLGVAFAAIYAYRRREGVWLVPLAWVLGYFTFMGAQFSLYMRYFLPLYPTLAVLAAVLLWKTWEWSASREPFAALGRAGRALAPLRPAVPVAARAGVAVVAVMTMLAGLAFYHIYTQPVSRTAASAWFHENVPEGSVVGHEHWDDIVPYTVEGVPPRSYGAVEFQNFNADTRQRVEQLLSNIEEVDYISLSSARLSGTIPRAPAVWPVTSRYYHALESGELGFEKVAEFTSYPGILGMEFDDTGAEESFSVYDHPQVVIYKKTSAYSPERARQVLHADAFIEGFSVQPGDAAQNLLQFTPEVRARQEAGGTWSDIFDPGDVFNAHPLFFWLVAMELAALALVPFAVVFFRGLPDRGFLLTKPLGVLGLAWLSYTAAAYGIADFTRGEIAAMLGLMLAAGAIAAVAWRAELLAWLRERWRFIVFAEALFLLAFLAAYWVRVQNPDLWHPSRGGEKPMDFAYFNGLLRTTDLTQGPIDPWHAGGYLNYYYFGQLISATLTKLTGIVPEVAYNLLVPMFFALTAAAAFSLTYNLAESTRRLMKRRPGGRPIGAMGPVVAGLAGVFFVLIAGNLRAVDQLALHMQRFSPWDPQITAFGREVPLIGDFITIIGGIKEIAFGDATMRQLINDYNWWDPSRALGVVDPATEVTPITEWPYWTFLFADLHAHLMSIPFAMTAAALALAVILNFTRVNDGRSPLGRHGREIAGWAMVLVLALVVGALRWINSWDFPPFLALGAAALIIAERAKEGRVTLRVLAIGAAKSLVMAALTVVLFAKLGKHYNTYYTSFDKSQQTSALHDYLTHFGVMVFIIAGFVLFSLDRAIVRSGGVRQIFFGRTRRGATMMTAPVTIVFVLAAALVVWAFAIQRWGVTGFALVGLIAVAVAAYRELRNPTGVAPVLVFIYAMIAVGLGLSGFVELYTLEGDIGRMNTVFKFYLHVWLLWAVVSAYALWYLFAVMRPHEAFLRRAGGIDVSLVRVARFALAAGAVVLIGLTLVYPYIGTRSRIHERFDPALGTGNNGMAYMDGAIYRDFDERTGRGGEHVLSYDRDGITWLREHVEGTPAIIEGFAPLYHLTSRISIYTGLPTVIGWDWHQSQQRARFAGTVQLRVQDVNLFYSTTDVQQARDILRKYDVRYVIVGDVERNYYPEPGIDKFNDGLGGALELAYQNPGMQIWHVIPPDELAATAP